MVERIGRMKPRILFFHLDASTGADFALLESLHRQCPETFVVLLADKSVKEELDYAGPSEWRARLLEP